MDIVDNDHTLLFNLFALVASIALLGFALMGAWILLIEFNIRLRQYREKKADTKLMQSVEELYNDFS